MTPDLPPVPAPLPSRTRRRWRWLHPASLWFWLATLPALLGTLVIVLMWWPGLAFQWKWSDRFYFERNTASHLMEMRDWAVLCVGPLEFHKVTGPTKIYASPWQGFQTVDSIERYIAGYFWETGTCVLIYRK